MYIYGRKKSFKPQEKAKYLLVKNYFEVEKIHNSTCIHLAENANLKEFSKLKTQKRNKALNLSIEITKHLCSKFDHVTYASSAYLYGTTSPLRHEETDPVEINHPYAEMKHNNEKAVLENGGAVARISNVYGEGMSKSGVIPRIIKQVSKKIIKVKSIFPIRDFIHVSDVASDISTLSIHRANGIFNIGTGIGTSIRELILLLISHNDAPKNKIVSLENYKSLSCLIINPEKMQKAFSIKPKKNIKQVLLNKTLQQKIAKNT